MRWSWADPGGHHQGHTQFGSVASVDALSSRERATSFLAIKDKDNAVFFRLFTICVDRRDYSTLCWPRQVVVGDVHPVGCH